MPHDNDTLLKKISQRRRVFQELKEAGQTPVVMEAYGGFGLLYGRIYREFGASGVVLEYNLDKARHLAKQRDNDWGKKPDGERSSGWVVVKAKSEVAIGLGLARWMPFNVLDADAHGSPWDVVDAFLSTCRPTREHPRAHADVVYIMATDGLPILKLKIEPQRINRMLPYIRKYGDAAVRRQYDRVAQEMIVDLASKAWNLEWFDFDGPPNAVAHWTAKLKWVGGTSADERKAAAGGAAAGDVPLTATSSDREIATGEAFASPS